MFNVKRRQIVLEIPKNGSRSLERVLITKYTKRAVKHAGHKTLRQLLGLVPPAEGKPYEVVGVVREPIARFRSQITHYCQIKNCGIKEALDACIDQSHVIFTPQHKFVDLPKEQWGQVELCLYPMEDIQAAQEHVAGQKVEIPLHVNRQQRLIDLSMIERFPTFSAALAMFEKDQKLYMQVKNG